MTQENVLLTRAVEEVVPKALAEEKLNSGKKMRLYLGIDPTGSKLHLGHSVPLRKLQAFADAGHEVIFLIGSYTAMIGDPTGRDVMREPLTKEQVQENFRYYKEQAGKILDFSKIEIRYNHEWLDNLNGVEILKISSNFTVQQMMQRDMFRERLKNNEDLSSTEFLYPLLQAYDSVTLDVDCEIGGKDQLFNMLCGRKLQQRYKKRDKFVLTTKLIEGTDGRKMSKTYDNCIWLEDSAKDMYGKILGIEDRLITTYMECCTDIPMEEIITIEKAMNKEENPMQFKKELAYEIVRMYHGEEAAKNAAAEFTKVFTDKQMPSDIPEVKAKNGEFLLDFLLREKLIASKGEGRRLLEQKGIHCDDKAVMDVNAPASPGTYKVGKRKFIRIV